MIQITASKLRRVAFAVFLALGTGFVPSVLTPGVQAIEPGQRTYASADEAVAALITAVRAGDRKELLAILGSTADGLITSGDPVQDKQSATDFLAAYDAKHSVAKRGADQAELIVGTNDWPLPIPVVQANGRWSFDGAGGIQELINRRVGKNELMTIRTLLGAVAAQQDYFERRKVGTGTGAFAQRILSTPGMTDGLYWDVDQGEAASPLGPLVDQAMDEGYPGAVLPGGKPVPYHGYMFRVLKAQGPSGPGGAKSYVRNGEMSGGFAFLAWPASYDNSGVMTFIVGPDGVVYQKDLGTGTARAAAAINAFDPDLTWTRIDIVE
jgi:hypothetical protein